MWKSASGVLWASRPRASVYLFKHSALLERLSKVIDRVSPQRMLELGALSEDEAQVVAGRAENGIGVASSPPSSVNSDAVPPLKP